MAGLPKIQNAQYGDSAKLEQLGAGRLTNNPAASVQTWKDPTGGRPPETDPVKLAMRSIGKPQKQTGQASPEQEKYQGLFNALAEQQLAVQKWVMLANSPKAGRVTKTIAAMAVKAYRESLAKVRAQTPFFEED